MIAAIVLAVVVLALIALVGVLLGRAETAAKQSPDVIDALLAANQRLQETLLELAGQVAAGVEQDRKERRTLLLAVMARTSGEFVANERALAAFEAVGDRRAPWSKEAVNAELERILAAHDSGETDRLDARDLLPHGLDG